jgi:hypothetical protein
LGEKYRSLSFSLCSFLQFLVPTSLLGPNHNIFFSLYMWFYSCLIM